MKKLLILSIAIFSLVSCSSNDENLDPFVGSWYPFSENGIEASTCEKKSSINIKENGTYNTTRYYFDQNECQADGSTNGTWTNLGNGIYATTRDGETDVDNTNVSFKDNNNTFVITSIEVENGETKTYTSTFKRK